MTEQDPERPAGRPPDDGEDPRWARWLSLAVGASALIALVLTIRSVGLAAILDQLRIIGWWFVPIVLLELAGTLADAAVIHGFLGPGGRRPGFLGVLKAQVAGRAINLVTPMASVGEATKVSMLVHETSSRRAVAAVVRFNLSYVGWNLASVVLGAPICAAVLPLPTWLERMLWIGSGVAVLVVTAVALLLRAGLVGSLIGALRGLRILRAERAKSLRQRLRDVDRSLRGDRGLRSWTPALWALVSKALGWAVVWIVMAVNGAAPSLGVMATLASAGTLVSIASNIVPMGIGVNEAGIAALMAALGESPSLGVTTVLARRVIQMVYAALGLTLLASAEAVPHKKKGAPRRKPLANKDEPG